MSEYGTKLEHYSTPRIIVISDGEANDPSEVKHQLERAKKSNVIIDCVALLSEDEMGKETLKNMAESTIGFPVGYTEQSFAIPQRGQFTLPEDIQSFLNRLTVLGNKKVIAKQEDTVLCIDISASMRKPYKGSKMTKIDAMKEAVEKFIDFKKKDPRDRIAVVACGGFWAKTLIKLTNDKSAIMKVVKKQDPFGGTPLGRALRHALDVLDWENRSKNFQYKEAMPLFGLSNVPKDEKCVFCEMTKGREPKIDKDTFDLLTGKYGFGAWKCPECDAYYHGFCFTGKGFTNGENGICFKCGTPLKVPLSVK